MSVSRGGHAEDAQVVDCVTIVNCGGTINMSGAQGARPDDMVSRSLDAVTAALPRRVSIDLVSPFDRPPDSSNMGAWAWTRIIDTVRAEVLKRHAALDRLPHRARAAGIVITHGTDTMAVTSLLLALEMASARLRLPIVFTGAHSTPDQADSDAFPNLVRAIALAGPGEEQVLPPGVFVVIGQDVHLASRLTKVETRPDRRGRYFHSFPAPIGQVTGKGATLKLDLAFLHQLRDSASPIHLRRSHWLGAVEHLVLDPFTPADVLLDLEQRLCAPLDPPRRRGVVLQGNFRASRAWPALLASIVRMAEADVPIAIGSRMVFEGLSDAVAGLPVGLVHRSLSHPSARLKLAWLLGTDLPAAAIPWALSTNLVGEVFHTHGLPDWIAYETYPNAVPGTEVVLVYPDIQPAVIQDAYRRLTATKRRRKLLYLYGFGHGHIPGVNISIATQVANWLHGHQFGIPEDWSDDLDLWSVLERLTMHLQHTDAMALRDRLLSLYALLPQGLLNAVCRAEAVSHQTATRRVLRSHLLDALGAFQQTTDATVDDLPQAVDALLRSVAWKEGKKPLYERFRACSDSDLLLKLIQSDPEVIARRLIKDAVMAANPLHREVGRATDHGVVVIPRTQVSLGVPDPTRYEAGTLLVAVGAGGDGPLALPWQHRVMVPRRDGDA